MAEWPKTVTFPIDPEDIKYFDLIREKVPAARSGVVAIRIALADYYKHHGPQPKEKGEQDTDLREIKAQLAGVSTAELKSLLLEIMLELRGNDLPA